MFEFDDKTKFLSLLYFMHSGQLSNANMLIELLVAMCILSYLGKFKCLY